MAATFKKPRFTKPVKLELTEAESQRLYLYKEIAQVTCSLLSADGGFSFINMNNFHDPFVSKMNGLYKQISKIGSTLPESYTNIIKLKRCYVQENLGDNQASKKQTINEKNYDEEYYDFKIHEKNVLKEASEGELKVIGKLRHIHIMTDFLEGTEFGEHGVDETTSSGSKLFRSYQKLSQTMVNLRQLYDQLILAKIEYQNYQNKKCE